MDPIMGAMESPTSEPAAPAIPVSAPESAPKTVAAEGASVDTLLDQIRAADKSATESVTPESSVGPSQQASEEPVSDQPPGEKAATEEPKPETAAQPENQEAVAESIRSLIKKSNLPPERKEELAALAYRGLQLQKLGFDYDQAELLKRMAVTPEVMVERVKIHPTIEDARTDAAFAEDMRELINDLDTQPEVAARKLYLTSPEKFKSMAAEIADNLDQLVPDKASEIRSSGFRNAMVRIAQRAEQTSNADLQSAAALILDHVFGGENAPAARDPNNPVYQENERLKALFRQQQEQRTQNLEAARGQFGTALQNYGAQAIFSDIKAALVAQSPTGMDAELVDRTAGDAFNGVVADLFQNQNFIKDMERFAAGPPTQEQLNNAIEFARSRARALAPLHLRTALGRWGKYAVKAAQQKEVTQQRAAGKPDVGKAVGAPTPSAAVPAHERALAEAKSRGLTHLETIQLHQQLMAARG